MHEWFIKNTKWDDLPARKYGGPEYVILRPEFARTECVPARIPRIFVSGGASDPKGVVLKVLRALDDLQADIAFDVMLSSIYPHTDELRAYRTAAKHEMAVWVEPERPWEIMARCQLAVLSFGVTAFETMAVGLPTLAISTSEDHLSAANELSTSFGLASLGLVEDVGEDDIAKVVRRLLDYEDIPFYMSHTNTTREAMSRSARKAVDGLGVERVAKTIVETIDARA